MSAEYVERTDKVDTRWHHMIGGVSTPHEEFPDFRRIELRVLDKDGVIQAWVERTMHKHDLDSTPSAWAYIYNEMTEKLEEYLASNDD